LSHHTLIIPPDFEQGFEELYQARKFPASPIVYLNETAQTDPTTAPAGCSNVFAVITCPAMEPHIDWSKEQAEYQSRIWKTLDRHNFQFDSSEIEFTRVQTPLTFQERDGNFLGSLYGPDEKHRLWGMMPLRCVDEEIKNLFYCGGSVQPGAGMPMVALSGKFAADLANR
jgi:phytoene dehydrogenase-like protein